VAALLAAVAAPPRLVANLRLVHDTALLLLDGLAHAFPTLTFDRAAVLFGAATHDIGKSVHISELSAPARSTRIRATSCSSITASPRTRIAAHADSRLAYQFEHPIGQ
jgi:hypothetical protein